MSEPRHTHDQSDMERRDFLKAMTAIGAAASLHAIESAWGAISPVPPRGPEPAASSPENYVVELYRSLGTEERKKLCMPLGHELRSKAAANWNITDVAIKDLNPAQQDLVENILRGITSEEGFEKFEKQMADDAGGLNSYHIGFFGEPGEKGFLLALTGRHVTIRADGNVEDGLAFGGPMVYGHAPTSFTEKPDHPGNVFWHQAKRANDVFAALDSKQRQIALLEQAPAEEDLTTGKDGYRGLAVGAMTSDQRELVQAVMRDLLGNYRSEDVDEAMRIIAGNGGIEKICLSFYKLGSDGKNGDLGSDRVWDIWRLEGPGLVWHFRGAPHVHGWVSLQRKEGA